MKLKKIIWLSFIAITIVFSSCKKELMDMNVDPNNPKSTDPDYVFTYSVANGLPSYTTEVNAGQWGLMYWVMYIAPMYGIEAGKEYQMSQSKDNLWSETYVNALNNAQEVIRLTKDNATLSNKYNIARIWKVILFQRLTDLWGDIPYSEALHGIDNYTLQPKYDTQQSIYYSLIDELKNSAESLDATKATFANGSDPIFNGDLTKWKKFANSLRFRLAIRISKVDPSYAQQVITDLQSVDLITSNLENAMYPYSNDNNHNPFYEVISNGQATNKNNPSKFFIDLLKSLNDPRIKVYAKPTPESVVFGIPDYDGVPNLLQPSASQWSQYQSNKFNISAFGDFFMRFDFPVPLISYSEVCFLKSEAALNGWYPGSAQQFYTDGVNANISYYSDTAIHQNDINNYISSLPAVSLENIITQKYISYAYQNEFEAYAEYRRTGYPVLKDYFGNTIDQANFPKRITYPVDELNLNSSNVNTAISHQGPDLQSTKLWWDVN